MNGQRAITVVLLVASLFVLGTLSASLEGTITSTPDDAIDVGPDSLPFVGDGASDIARSYNRPAGESAAQTDPQSAGDAAAAASGPDDPDGGSAGDSTGQAAADQSARGNGDGAGGGSERAGMQGSAGTGDDRASAGQGNGDGSAGGRGSGDGGAGGQDQGEGPGTGTEQSLWDLLSRVIASLLAILAVLAAAVLLARHRDRLLARLRALAGRFGTESGGDPDGVAVPDGEGDAATVVERAWGTMVHRSGAEPPTSATPRECARAVVTAGTDREAVEGLTEMYERVRYGRNAVTPDDARRALNHLRTVTPDTGAAQPEPTGERSTDRQANRAGDGGATPSAGDGPRPDRGSTRGAREGGRP